MDQGTQGAQPVWPKTQATRGQTEKDRRLAIMTLPATAQNSRGSKPERPSIVPNAGLHELLVNRVYAQAGPTARMSDRSRRAHAVTRNLEIDIILM
jgi:hypothetical protein